MEPHTCHTIIHALTHFDFYTAVAQEFCSSTGDEETKFWELFEATGRGSDRVTSKTVGMCVRQASIAATSHAFNRWLRAAGCETNVRVNIEGKTTSCVTGLRERNSDREALMLGDASSVGEKRKRDDATEMPAVMM